MKEKLNRQNEIKIENENSIEKIEQIEHDEMDNLETNDLMTVEELKQMFQNTNFEDFDFVSQDSDEEFLNAETLQKESLVGIYQGVKIGYKKDGTELTFLQFFNGEKKILIGAAYNLKKFFIDNNFPVNHPVKIEFERFIKIKGGYQLAQYRYLCSKRSLLIGKNETQKKLESERKVSIDKFIQ